jgi:hypothetical protein
MKLNLLVYQRMLFTYAAIFVAVALVLVFGVMEPVKVEASIGATEEIAVKAFWVIIGLNLLSAALLSTIAHRLEGESWLSILILWEISDTKWVIIVGGFIVIFLGVLLVDAALAYQSHGPAMQTASLLLFFCAVADALTGALLVITAFLQPKKA